MIFELIGAIIEGASELIGDLFDSGTEALTEAAALTAELGTAVVGIGAGAAALGALIALAELSVNAIRKYLNSKEISSQIEDILNNDENTLNKLLPQERLAGAKQYKISEMHKVVHNVKKTSDGQTVATVRIIHPKSGVYTDVAIAGNKNTDVYEGLSL